MANANLTRDQFNQEFGDAYSSELCYDAYTQLCENWEDDTIEILSNEQLKQVLGIVHKQFDFSEYFDQIDRRLVDAVRHVRG